MLKRLRCAMPKGKEIIMIEVWTSDIQEAINEYYGN